MPRKHLFVVVVLLGAAAVAGLLALTRTSAVGAVATQPSSAQLASRSRSLDELEASLRRALAELPSAQGATPGAGAPRTVYVRPSTASFDDEHGDDEDEHEEEHGDEGADD